MTRVMNVFKMYVAQTSSSSSSSGSRCVTWLGECLSMPFPNYPVLCCTVPYRIAPVFARSSLHRKAGLPCRIFLSYDLLVVTREVHRSSLRWLICSAQDYFICLTVLIIYDFCPLPDPGVGLSIFVRDIEHTCHTLIVV